MRSLAAIDYTPIGQISDRLFSFPIPSDSGAPQSAVPAASGWAKTGNCRIFNRLLRRLSAPTSFLRQILARIPILDFQVLFSPYPPPSIDPPRCSFRVGSCLRRRKGQFSPCRKIQSRQVPSSQCILRTPLRPLRPGLPDFTVSSPSRYPVATGKAAILPTMFPRW